MQRYSVANRSHATSPSRRVRLPRRFRKTTLRCDLRKSLKQKRAGPLHLQVLPTMFRRRARSSDSAGTAVVVVVTLTVVMRGRANVSETVATFTTVAATSATTVVVLVRRKTGVV